MKVCPHVAKQLVDLKMLWKYCLSLVACLQIATSARLDSANDEAVIEAIRENQNLVLLFTKKGCSTCPYEQSLSALRNEFESTFGGKVLKLESSHLQRVYDPQKSDASVIFIRSGVALLLPNDIADTPDAIFDFFNDNRDPVVKELDDSNFEHLTQASTGSTTGDWLIQFYDSQCIDCNRLAAVWEAVGAKLKMRMNVARVNRGTKGILTAKRFKVDQVPEFIFLRMGKYYRYNLKKFDIESFVGFATSWYSRVAAEKVSTPATPFETLIDFIVTQLRDLPDFVLPSFMALIAFIVVAALFLTFKKAKPSPKAAAASTKNSKKE